MSCPAELAPERAPPPTLVLSELPGVVLGRLCLRNTRQRRCRGYGAHRWPAAFAMQPCTMQVPQPTCTAEARPKKPRIRRDRAGWRRWRAQLAHMPSARHARPRARRRGRRAARARLSPRRRRQHTVCTGRGRCKWPRADLRTAALAEGIRALVALPLKSAPRQPSPPHSSHRPHLADSFEPTAR
eukprot:366391-Chlamydomonas_euryale.AAC.37